VARGWKHIFVQVVQDRECLKSGEPAETNTCNGCGEGEAYDFSKETPLQGLGPLQRLPQLAGMCGAGDFIRTPVSAVADLLRRHPFALSLKCLAKRGTACFSSRRQGAELNVSSNRAIPELWFFNRSEVSALR
jgi:hypothetical protein